MYLLILESFGTQELILIGIVALIVFGPRKLPGLARKAGKMMRELKSVSNDFRTTWEKEVNFEEEKPKNSLPTAKESETYFDEGQSFGEEIEIDSKKSRENNILPEIKEVTAEDFEKLVEQGKKLQNNPAKGVSTDKSEWF